MPNSHIKPTTHPGQCVSVDQMVSTTPGFVAKSKEYQQLKGTNMLQSLLITTPDILIYTNIASEQTMAAKHTFELMAKGAGVQIKHYHVDDGRFADNSFLKNVELQGQTITFCGVRAHFQNGIAEKRIRNLQERACTMLIHAKQQVAQSYECIPLAIRNETSL
jgi:hypothetical protein